MLETTTTTTTAAATTTSPGTAPQHDAGAADAPPGGAAAYLQLMRPVDWSKNALVFAALVFSGHLLNAGRALHACGAFVAFCLLASGFYALNDALDVESDRLHPVKRRRPVARGAIAARAAVGFGVALIAAGLAAGFAVDRMLGAICLAYAALQVLYNRRLKRVVMVDVVSISLGFILRAAGGAAAVDVQVSVWLVLCVFFLCLFLGFVKRLSDLTSAAAAEPAGRGWRSPAAYDRGPELNWLLAVSGTLAVMTYMMYALSVHAREIFGARSTGFALLTPLVVIATFRMYRRALLGRSDRPVDALFEDAGVRASTVLFAVGIVAIVYAPHVDVWLNKLFLL